MSEGNYSDAFGVSAKLLSLEENLKLKIGVDGYSNIDDWSTRLSWLLKANFGEFAKVVATRVVPKAWTEPPKAPSKAEEEEMSSLEREAATAAFKEANAYVLGWKRSKARMIPHILENITKTSLERILEREKDKFEQAVGDDDVLKVIELIHDAHRYKNRDAKKETEINLNIAFLSFALTTGEKLAEYKTRWDLLIKQLEAVKIKKTPGDKVYFFLRGLKSYPSLGVRSLVTMNLCGLEDLDFAAADEENAKEIPSVLTMFDMMSAIIAAEAGSTTRGAPMALPAVAAGAAGRMSEKIRRGAIDGTPGNDKADGPTRSRLTTEQLVEKKISQGKTRKEALKEIICHNCGKAGHIKAECRSESNPDGVATNQRKNKKKTKKSGDALLADDENSDVVHAAEADDFEEGDFMIEDIDCFMLNCDHVKEVDPELYIDASYCGMTEARCDALRDAARISLGDEAPTGPCPFFANAVVANRAEVRFAGKRSQLFEARVCEEGEEWIEVESKRAIKGRAKALSSLPPQPPQPPPEARSAQHKLCVNVGAYAMARANDAEREANKDFFYDDTLANVCMVFNTDLLTTIKRLETPLGVNGVGGAEITEVGIHPFLGRVLILRSLKYNIVPQAFWTRKYGYSVTIAPDGRWLRFSRKGCSTVEFLEHTAHGRSFRRAHNSMLRWQATGDITPPPRHVPDDGEGSRRTPVPASYEVNAGIDGALQSGKYYTPEQRQRAAEAAQLHVTMGHPSDEVLKVYLKSPSLTNCHLSPQDVVHMRDIEGPCVVCLSGKPQHVRGRNSLHEALGVTEPGQLLHCDIVYWNKRVYLLCVDEITGYLMVPQIVSKRATDLMIGFRTVIDAMRAARRVVQYVHTDAEAVFEAIREPLHEQGVSLKLRIPGEHEVVAERAFRSLREKIRVHIIGLQREGITHPQILDPYLVQHCVNIRNRTPNSRSGSAIPYELMYGERVNYLTDCRVGYMNLILTTVPAAAQTTPTSAKHEVCLCLGIVGRRTPGAVWALSMSAARPQQRRPLKVMPWTEDWRREVVVLVEKGLASSVSEFLLEFGGKHTRVESAEERAENLADGVPDADQILEHSGADTPVVAPNEPMDVQQHRGSPNKTRDGTTHPTRPEETKTTMGAHSDATTGDDVPTTNERDRAEEKLGVASNAPMAKSGGVDDNPSVPNGMPVTGSNTEMPNTPNMAELRRSVRARKPNSRYANLACFLNLGDRSMDDLMVTLPRVQAHRSRDTFGCFDADEEGALDDARGELLCMVTSLESALRTKYKDEAIAATKKELKSLLEHKTWRYLNSIEERQPSVHRGVEPSACVLKDKKDSFGQFLLFKSRFYNVGSHTHDNNYGAFDKTSPTASHDTICLLLALASYHKWHLETFDVPSAYLKAPLEEGKRHCMRINKTVTQILLEVDQNARRYVQPDGTILVELLQALYGLPEAGKLWHTFLCNVLTKAGYKSMPGDTCLWKRIVNSQGTQHVSIIAIIVDDCLHAYNKLGAREHLYTVMQREHIPRVTVQQLSDSTPISFCGISIEYLRGRGLFMSQPGYLLALVNEYAENDRVYPTPLPNNFSSRTLSENQKQPLPGGTGKYLRVLNSIAWMERTRPDIAAAVSYLQTEQAEPRLIDWADVQHLLGYLRGTSNLGILYNATAIAPLEMIDCAFGVHVRDRKSHTGSIRFMCPDGPAIGWSSGKQKSVASSSTNGEMISLSDKADGLLLTQAKLEFLQVKVQLPMAIHQDNTSTITISYMGRPSAHARKRYIDIRYFWLKQYLDNGVIKLVYCPTAIMWADALASVRHGQDFVQFVQRVMTKGPERVEAAR